MPLKKVYSTKRLKSFNKTINIRVTMSFGTKFHTQTVLMSEKICSHLILHYLWDQNKDTIRMIICRNKVKDIIKIKIKTLYSVIS